MGKQKEKASVVYQKKKKKSVVYQKEKKGKRGCELAMRPKTRLFWYSQIKKKKRKRKLSQKKKNRDE